MSKLVAIFATLALGCIALAALAFGWTALTLGHYAAYTLGNINTTLQEINRPCGGKDSCGTLADVAKTLNTIRGTVGQIEIAAQHENKNLTTLDAQEAQLFEDIHVTTLTAQDAALAITETSHGATAALGTLNTDLKTLDVTIADARPVLKNAAAAVKSTSDAADQLNIILKASAIPATLKNVDGMTENGNRILKDAADEADKFMHPPKKKLTFWGAIDGAFLWLHSRVIPPIL